MLGNYQPIIAEPLREGMRGKSGPVTIRYAAAADPAGTGTHPIESGKSLYYRIQGGGLSIEFDNTSEEADHIHVVYRHPSRDFGRDILAEHLATSPHNSNNEKP